MQHCTPVVSRTYKAERRGSSEFHSNPGTTQQEERKRKEGEDGKVCVSPLYIVPRKKTFNRLYITKHTGAIRHYFFLVFLLSIEIKSLTLIR